VMGLKGLFENSKLLFQYSNTPTLQYSSLKYFDHIQKLESYNYNRLKCLSQEVQNVRTNHGKN